MRWATVMHPKKTTTTTGTAAYPLLVTVVLETRALRAAANTHLLQLLHRDGTGYFLNRRRAAAQRRAGVHDELVLGTDVEPH